MHGANTAPLELRLESEIELGRVDADEQRHARAQQPRAKVAADANQLGDVPEHLDEAAHGELLDRIPRLAALGLHLRTRDASEANAGMPRADRTDQRRGERIARRLARDDADERTSHSRPNGSGSIPRTMPVVSCRYPRAPKGRPEAPA